jgi:hypothetical protein
MHHEEPGQKQHCEEMQRAGRLPAAEHVGQPRQDRARTRRHREAGDEGKRHQREQHDPVAQLLQAVVSRALGEAQPRVSDALARQGPDVRAGDPEVVPQVAVGEARDKPGDERRQQHPGEEEMDDTPRRKVEVGWRGGPGGKCPGLAAGNAEQPGRLELPPEDLDMAGDSLAPDDPDPQHRVVEGEARLFADVERGVRAEYLQPRSCEEEQADHPGPVADPRPNRLAVDQTSR